MSDIKQLELAISPFSPKNATINLAVSKFDELLEQEASERFNKKRSHEYYPPINFSDNQPKVSETDEDQYQEEKENFNNTRQSFLRLN